MADSMMIMRATSVVPITMAGPRTFGSTCRSRMRPWVMPRARAAWTNSSSRTCIVLARVTRAKVVHSSSPSSR